MTKQKRNLFETSFNTKFKSIMRKQVLLQILSFSSLFQIKKLFKNELINIMFIHIKRKKQNVFIEKKKRKR